MTICPACLGPTINDFGLDPGRHLVCPACGACLHVTENFALAVSRPEELVQLSPTLFRATIENCERVLAQRWSKQQRKV